MKKLSLVICFLLVLCMAGNVSAVRPHSDIIFLGDLDYLSGNCFYDPDWLIVGTFKINATLDKYNDVILHDGMMYSEGQTEQVFLYLKVPALPGDYVTPSIYWVKEGAVMGTFHMVENKLAGTFGGTFNTGHLGQNNESIRITGSLSGSDVEYTTFTKNKTYFTGQAHIIINTTGSNCYINIRGVETKIINPEFIYDTFSWMVQWIEALDEQLHNLKQWLFFWSYQETDVCDAIANECEVIPPPECTTDDDCNYLDNDYCDGDNLMHKEGICIDGSCVSGTPTVVEDCEYGCQDGTCIPSECDVTDTLNEGETKTYNVDGKDYGVTLNYVGSTECVLTVNSETTSSMEEGESYQLTNGRTIKVIDITIEEFEGGLRKVIFCFVETEPVIGKVVFRTNVVNEDYYGDWDKWIAIDWDVSSGNYVTDTLIGYGSKVKTTSGTSSRCAVTTTCGVNPEYTCIIGYTPSGLKVVNYLSSSNVLICVDPANNRKQVMYLKGDPDSAGAVLSTSPTEPYASNGQEVYE